MCRLSLHIFHIIADVAVAARPMRSMLLLLVFMTESASLVASSSVDQLYANASSICRERRRKKTKNENKNWYHMKHIVGHRMYQESLLVPSQLTHTRRLNGHSTARNKFNYPIFSLTLYRVLFSNRGSTLMHTTSSSSSWTLSSSYALHWSFLLVIRLLSCGMPSWIAAWNVKHLSTASVMKRSHRWKVRGKADGGDVKRTEKSGRRRTLVPIRVNVKPNGILNKYERRHVYTRFCLSIFLVWTNTF